MRRAPLLLGTVAGMIIHLGLPGTAIVQALPELAPTPSLQPSPGTGTDSDKPPPWDVVGRARHAINAWIAELVTSALDPVFALLGRTVFSTPRLDQHPRIVELRRFSLGIADAGLVLLVLAGAGIVMASGSLSSQITAKELLPRLLLAAGAANLSLLVAGQAISVANGLSTSLLGGAIDPAGVSRLLSERLFSVGADNSLFLIFVLAAVILAVLILVAYVVRIAVLVLLLIAGPLVLVTHALPQTEHLARTWWRLVGAMIAAPVAQALVVAATIRVFLSSEGVLGFSTDSLIDLLVVSCLLYVLYRIPLWSIHLALRGAGFRTWMAAKGISIAVKAAA